MCYLIADADLDGDGTLECDVTGSRDDCLGDPELVADCAPGARKWLRFLGEPADPVPTEGAHLFVACQVGVFRPNDT
jgi:hypothetical protein